MDCLQFYVLLKVPVVPYHTKQAPSRVPDGADASRCENHRTLKLSTTAYGMRIPLSP